MSLPFELAKRVTSYFDWNINEHLDLELEEKWPKVPADFGDPKISTGQQNHMYTVNHMSTDHPKSQGLH